MTKNEKKMMFELAKGMVRLGDMAAILAKKMDDQDDFNELKNLIETNQLAVQEFIDLANKEWLQSE
jgi:hypothetical protein